MQHARGIFTQGGAALWRARPRCITAFWGLETDFGGYMGDFHTIRSLATLSFRLPPAGEIPAAGFRRLQILDRGDMTEDEMVGAWAGEIGQVQFLPADFLESGVDADGDGRVDLKRSIPDILMSTAKPSGQSWLAGQSALAAGGRVSRTTCRGKRPISPSSIRARNGRNGA